MNTCTCAATDEGERKKEKEERAKRIKLKHTLSERITNERGIEQSYWSVRPIDQLNISLFVSLLVRSVCSRLYTHGTIARDGPRYFRLSDRVRWVEAPGAPLITLTYDPINHRQIIHYLSRRGTKAGARSLSRPGKGAHTRLSTSTCSFLPYTHDFPRPWKWAYRDFL